jgi:general secretion pathway protein G
VYYVDLVIHPLVGDLQLGISSKNFLLLVLLVFFVDKMIFLGACMKKNAGVRGFTLLELMFSIAIIAVLTAIAVPSYTGYIDKAKNATAISDILIIQLESERLYTNTFRYPTTLSDISANLPNNGIDPWGKAYVYLNIVDGGHGIKGQVRKDHKLNPINSNYDLYSMGKNGVSKTQIDNKDSVDDIILARDGSFVGLASDF